MALVRAPIPARTVAGPRQKPLARMSANIGVAPAMSIASAEAKKLNGVVMTSSPLPTPSARSERNSESVPLATPIACLTPIVFGEFALEGLRLRAEDEAAVRAGVADRGEPFVREIVELGGKFETRHRRRIGYGVHEAIFSLTIWAARSACSPT